MANEYKLSHTAAEIDEKLSAVEKIQSQIDIDSIANTRQNLNYIGLNPITTPDEDTPANWIALGTGIAFINGTGQLNNQPTPYGYIENYTDGDFIYQAIHSLNGRSTVWSRSGTKTKWYDNSVNWVKQLDENNGIQMKKLWENASPTSAFAAQTINLDLSEYDAVMVISYTADSIKLRVVGFSEITSGASNGFVLSTVYGTDNKIYGLYRIMYVTTTGVQIGDAYTTTPSADAKSTSAQIPFQIYGIKGVQ